MDSKQVEELAAGYVLSVLSSEERREFDAHVAGCPACQKLVGELRTVAGLLPLAVDPVKPPRRLGARLLAQAQADLRAQAAPGSSGRAGARDAARAWLRVPAWYRAAAALATLAVIGLAVWNVHLQSTLNDREQQLTRLREAERLAVATGTEAAPQAAGELVYLPEQRVTILRVQGLPALPEVETYQVWLIADGKATSAGLLQVSPSTNEGTALVIGDVRRSQVLAVSVEPASGMPQPTGRIVLKAPL
jgi:anti-sigma-K factor RskA